jgi:hypothetical protein
MRALATRIRTNVDNAVVQFQHTTTHPGLCVTTSSNVLERSTLTAHQTYNIDSCGASHPLQHGYILRTCVGTKLGTYLLNKGNEFIVTTFGPNVGIPCITTSVSMQFILDTEGSPWYTTTHAYSGKPQFQPTTNAHREGLYQENQRQ